MMNYDSVFAKNATRQKIWSSETGPGYNVSREQVRQRKTGLSADPVIGKG
jgi:hypothetical protein